MEDSGAKRRKLNDEGEGNELDEAAINSNVSRSDGDGEDEDDGAHNVGARGDGLVDGAVAPVPVQLSSEDLKMLLEPLSKEQLVTLLVDAGFQYPAIADDIRDIASKDPAHRKLFVRGLAWETSSQALRDAFEPYGEIEEGAVIVDKSSGKSRGFGFITYKHMDSAQRALKEPSKTIDGRITVCNLAAAGPNNPSGTGDQSQRKLYIGGLSYETTTETIIKLFSPFGEIEEGAVAYDKKTSMSRGFAFVTYKTAEAARRALEEATKNIEGRSVIIKLADGQKDKPASLPAAQPTPQVQSGFPVNPALAGYSRTQAQAGAGPSIAFPGYSSGLAAAYAAPSVYGGLPAAQYGAGGQYAPYGGGYAAGQAVQPGLHSGTIGGNGVLPPLYYGPAQ